jgi:hypothetical protein
LRNQQIWNKLRNKRSFKKSADQFWRNRFIIVKSIIRESGKNLWINVRFLDIIVLRCRVSILLYKKFGISPYQSLPKHEWLDRGLLIQSQVSETAYVKLFDIEHRWCRLWSDSGVHFTCIILSHLEIYHS